MTESSGCTSVFRTTRPAAWSWSSSQRSIQRADEVADDRVLVHDERRRGDRDHAAVADRPSRCPRGRASPPSRRATDPCRRSRRRGRLRGRPSARAPRRPSSAPSRTSSAPSSAASARRLESVSTAIVELEPSSRMSWSAMWPTPPTPITTAVVPGDCERRQPAHRVVGGEAGIGMRRDLGRLDPVGQPHERALRDEHVVGEAAVDGEPGELVPRAVHVVAAAAGDAEAAAERRVDEHRVALRDRRHPGADLLHPTCVLVAEDARQRDAGGLHQPLDRVQVGGADPGAADPDEHVRRAPRARAPADRRARAAGGTRA